MLVIRLTAMYKPAAFVVTPCTAILIWQCHPCGDVRVNRSGLVYILDDNSPRPSCCSLVTRINSRVGFHVFPRTTSVTHATPSQSPLPVVNPVVSHVPVDLFALLLADLDDDKVEHKVFTIVLFIFKLHSSADLQVFQKRVYKTIVHDTNSWT